MKDRVIAVTGAAGILGSALARRLASDGAQIVGIDLAKSFPADLPLALPLPGVDLADETAINAAFAAVTQRFGKLDGLANIAGGFRWETLEGGAIETWDKLYTMNVRTAVLACKAATPLLAKNGGAIVNVSANATFRADAGMGAYTASKSGVSRLTESLAAELKDKGVRVNAVMPSIIDTPANRADMPDAQFDRWVTPDALSDAISFLLSDAARAITGALLPVTGRV